MKDIYKNICLRLPKEMLDKIDISVKNNRGYSRTTWVLQALDYQLKAQNSTVNTYHDHIIDLPQVDKKTIITYDKNMKNISVTIKFAKIFLISLILATIAGCVGGAVASLGSVWSVASGVSIESVEAHSIAPEERANIVKEIKEEVILEMHQETLIQTPLQECLLPSVIPGCVG